MSSKWKSEPIKDSGELCKTQKMQVEFFIPGSDAAKTLKLDPLQLLFQWLYENRWIFRRGKNWRAFQSKIDAGLVEHKYELTTLPDGREMLTTQARVTSKGLAFLASIFA